tara:strand:- start:16704 stop:17552 length:849 start_codon:yes stop_codon:yes gene_type:complete
MKKNKIVDIKKLKNLNTAFATLTAYDFPSAQIINTLNIPLVLVGDSASMVVYGYRDTTSIGMDEMLLICRAVQRGTETALLVGDMPFMSYQPSVEIAITNAGRFIKEGKMDAVKLEGGKEYVNHISAIINAGIPVMGHIGLKPQSVLIESGYKIKGKNAQDALKIYQDAIALEKAGVFALVLEGIPEEVAHIITQTIKIPTIGIGAGGLCDGQIQVLHDVIGLLGSNIPKHAKIYMDAQSMIKDGLTKYQLEVQKNQFPTNANTIKMNQKELQLLKQKIENL